MLVLKPEYQELADIWDNEYGEGSCSCSTYEMPPCVWCEKSGRDEGSPEHLSEHPEFWEDEIINLRRGYTMTEEQINLDNALQVLIEKKTFSLDSVERIKQIRLEVEELRASEIEHKQTISAQRNAINELKAEHNSLLGKNKELRDQAASVLKREKEINNLELKAENAELRREDISKILEMVLLGKNRN